ncbi:MAG: hypothetical protein J07HX5_00599 [halophilic archaeon J07HX5]|nr:MAG: hypothetical protein J07HX5_00599 [halophilic archaeon J07HX5]
MCRCSKPTLSSLRRVTVCEPTASEGTENKRGGSADHYGRLSFECACLQASASLETAQ